MDSEATSLTTQLESIIKELRRRAKNIAKLIEDEKTNHICPVCSGLGVLLCNNAIRSIVCCNQCGGTGVVWKCPECAAITSYRPFFGCDNVSCKVRKTALAVWELKQQQKLAAGALTWATYKGPSFYFTFDDYFHGYPSLEALMNGLMHREQVLLHEKPTLQHMQEKYLLCHGSVESHFHFDARMVLDVFDEFESVPEGDVIELQRALNKWCARTDSLFEVDLACHILIPWKDYKLY